MTPATSITPDASLKSRFSCLLGEKTALSQFTANDITSEYLSWLNDPEVVKYSNQRFRTHTLATCMDYFTSFASTENLFIKVERKTDGLFVGTMTAYYNSAHRTVDIGIMLGRRTVWGSGLGQDAWRTLLAWLLAQDSVRKVTAGTMRCNRAMVRLMEHSGMTLEAVRPQQELLDGMPQDLLYYGVFHVA